jgi:response regulator NasT
MSNIVLVSADATLYKRLKTALEQNKLGVATVVHDSKTALELCRQHPPVLAVIDLFLPAMSGLELIQKLKQNQDLRIMLISRVRTRHLLERAFRYGADDILILPFTDETFLSYAFQRLGRAELAPPTKSI